MTDKKPKTEAEANAELSLSERLAAAQEEANAVVQESAVSQGAYDGTKETAHNDPKLMAETRERVDQEAEDARKDREKEQKKGTAER